MIQFISVQTVKYIIMSLHNTGITRSTVELFHCDCLVNITELSLTYKPNVKAKCNKQQQT